jgi:hypothetical protein
MLMILCTEYPLIFPIYGSFHSWVNILSGIKLSEKGFFSLWTLLINNKTYINLKFVYEISYFLNLWALWKTAENKTTQNWYSLTKNETKHVLPYEKHICLFLVLIDLTNSLNTTLNTLFSYSIGMWLEIITWSSLLCMRTNCTSATGTSATGFIIFTWKAWKWSLWHVSNFIYLLKVHNLNCFKK